jgi:hypothetical protein
MIDAITCWGSVALAAANVFFMIVHVKKMEKSKRKIIEFKGLGKRILVILVALAAFAVIGSLYLSLRHYGEPLNIGVLLSDLPVVLTYGLTIDKWLLLIFWIPNLAVFSGLSIGLLLYAFKGSVCNIVLAVLSSGFWVALNVFIIEAFTIA